ncbi:outer membrane protein assembly factor BamE domain-containing protein [Candidatus Sulfurimonas baltica]|uniref:Outer membrane protein assembly factor BamE n=1 Tax=Candidatus Sulfurimonas baltica TaxID=2740404 RepID=A0A7S7RMB1_9BACT|nr:outer membrane protein assembly factor BamE [Candidatus Sulfurimonas baltica]QOY51987.1 outer membrane protein assembly factor BamE [Candidatus Sulfurimonas baltica]
MRNIVNKIGLIWIFVIATSVLSVGGCARIGTDFKTQNVQEIKIGETTQEQIVAMFGKPWRQGVMDGVTQWTYGRYTYRLIGETDTKDLVVKFDNSGRVSSYTFNTTDVK